MPGWFGLARVALERGDEPGSLRLAREALAIDPENSAARRTIDRLEEVARFRVGTASPTDREPGPAPSPDPAGPAPARPGILRRLFRRS